MIIFIVPAYNEEENITSLLSKMDSKMKALKADYRLILVNDGSVDMTKSRALEFAGKIPMEIVDLYGNKGVGHCFIAGFRRALELAGDEDIIVTKEADNTSDLEILEKMLDSIAAGYDMVLASCFAPDGKVIGVPPIRFALSFMANNILRLIYPIDGVHTYSSFYRAYKARMLRKAFYAYDNRLIEDSNFTCMVEMLVKLSRLPIRIKE
ncbi:MAG: glycosyltransferase family 2 protein, partial [Candidatus Omnitrophota bacterium]|nr:glycosyltransferase family 2 protein [Candidatus Omnitrophota bacterium]